MSARRRISRSKGFEKALANDVLDALAWGHERAVWKNDLADLTQLIQTLPERGKRVVGDYVAEQKRLGRPGDGREKD